MELYYLSADQYPLLPCYTLTCYFLSSFVTAYHGTLLFRGYPTFIWHASKTVFPHLYMALFPLIIITPLSGTFSLFTIPPLYDTISFFIFSADITHLYLWLYCTSLSVTFSSYYAGTCSAEGSFCTHLNMVSFSLFLSHLYMTLILFIVSLTWKHYFTQLPQGLSAEDFTPSLISPLPWVLHFPRLIRGGFFTIFFAFNRFFSRLSLAFLLIIAF